MINHDNIKLCIVGLGYVGLPLAIEFAKFRSVIGFDINKNRISELLKGIDKTGEVDTYDLKNLSKLVFTSNPETLAEANCFIITVPTPIDDKKNPDLSLIKSACEMVGKYLKKDAIVIIESTVYPGITEEFCAPILSKVSGLKFNQDFFCGYSPERINPGDKNRRIKDIVKVTSGSTPATADIVDTLYKQISMCGTHKTATIKIAEAAKVIENTQRDLNIAFINEIAMLFDLMEIPSKDVLEAAKTKWNFLNFKPGLVGGHCIGVDPYYLTYKAETLGFIPQTILAGRRVNDQMSRFVVDSIIKKLKSRGESIIEASILIMGISFKENCPDIRNSKVFDLIEAFQELGASIDVYDPIVDSDSLEQKHRSLIVDYPEVGKYSAIIFAVPHDVFRMMSVDSIHNFGKESHFIYDVKHELTRGENVFGV